MNVPFGTYSRTLRDASLKYFNGCIRSLSIDFALYISKCRDANKSWMVKNEKYVQAYQLNPKAALPLLGLAQMTLSEKDNTNAITLLETALQLHPGWNDAPHGQLPISALSCSASHMQSACALRLQ